MQQHGYKIYPVNPSVPEVLGEKSYATLTDLVAAGHKPDIVNVFRLPKFIPAIVDEMLQLGLKNIWVQQGIINLEAAARPKPAASTSSWTAASWSSIATGQTGDNLASRQPLQLNLMNLRRLIALPVLFASIVSSPPSSRTPS